MEPLKPVPVLTDDTEIHGCQWRELKPLMENEKALQEFKNVLNAPDIELLDKLIAAQKKQGDMESLRPLQPERNKDKE